MTAEFRDRVFVSYSHHDDDWRKKFEKKLLMMAPNDKIIWSDERIETGEHWQDQIETAIRSTKVALLLVSDNFLTSDYIKNQELPKILREAEDGNLTISWIPLNWVCCDSFGLTQLQTAWNPEKPLDGLSEPDCDRAIYHICKDAISRLGASVRLDNNSCQDFKSRVSSRLQSYNYKVHAELAVGDLSIVYCASQAGKSYAVKAVVESPLQAGAMEVIERRLRQTESLGGSFIHINARLLDEEPRCIVMDFIEAPTLAKILQKEGPLEPARAAAIMGSLAQALAELHQHGNGELIYGSLRPSEIFLLGNDEVRLSAIDFSNELLRSERLRGNIFMTHDLPTYMTPEQYYGWPMNAKTDQYSLALLGLELLLGSPPNRVHNPVDLEDRRNFFDDPSASIGEWRREYPGLAEVLLRMLSKNPEMRFASIRDVVELVRKPRVNRIVIDKLKEHYNHCRKQGLDVFYQLFYNELFRICPDVQNHFKSISWQRQFEMLDFAIEILLEFDLSRSQFRLNDMLSKHDHLGLSKDHISKFFEAFISTLHRFMNANDPASNDLLDMWRAAIDPGMRYMTEQISLCEVGS